MSLHSRSGKESGRIFLNFDKLNKIYDDAVLYKDSWSILLGYQSKDLGSVEDFICSCIDMTVITPLTSSKFKFEMTVHKVLREAHLRGGIDYYEDSTLRRDIAIFPFNHNRIGAHNDTLRLKKNYDVVNKDYHDTR
jgi:hypothetical protein